LDVGEDNSQNLCTGCDFSWNRCS